VPIIKATGTITKKLELKVSPILLIISFVSFLKGTILIKYQRETRIAKKKPNRTLNSQPNMSKKIKGVTKIRKRSRGKTKPVVSKRMKITLAEKPITKQ